MPANQQFTNVLLYIKKLKEVSTSCETPVKLHEKDPKQSIVVSLNEPFDLLADDEYFQILLIESSSKPNVISDLVFCRHNLLELAMDPSHTKDEKRRLRYTAPLERNYVLEFRVQLVDDAVKGNKLNHQPIQGHLLLVKQFNQPVYCAICKQFIWGIYHQGYECLHCSLVTHRKCHQRIPFWCQKSPYPDPNLLTENRRIECHIPHEFKYFEASFIQSLVSGAHTYCNHCGSQVLRKALKCKKCEFIIHKYCQANVPPMCGLSYGSVKKGGLQINEPKPDPFVPEFKTHSLEQQNNYYDDTVSVDIRWLDPLPYGGLISLPKFSDFECIGRLGQGRYGNVFCVQHIVLQEYFAIKVVDGLIEEARQQFESERQILYRYSCGNPYMIKAYCTFHQGSKLFLVMELADGDALKQKIPKTRMNEDDIRFYLAEIISVLQYLHSNKIVHRDLKLDHTIVSSDGHIRLVDYGLGRLLKTSDEKCHTFCGTVGYVAPEVHHLTGDGYSYPVDFWALGIIFAQLLCGEQIYPQMIPESTDELNLPFNFDENIQLPSHISSEARSCLSGLLEIDPNKRLGSPNSPHGSICEHPFFNVGRKIDWEEIEGGLFKSNYKDRSIKPIPSDISVDLPLPTLLLERGILAKADWIAAGESTCTIAEEEQFKLFDYVNQSSWGKFNLSKPLNLLQNLAL